jgi:hypothetical protein
MTLIKPHVLLSRDVERGAGLYFSLVLLMSLLMNPKCTRAYNQQRVVRTQVGRPSRTSTFSAHLYFINNMLAKSKFRAVFLGSTMFEPEPSLLVIGIF